jgi:hypothetical protein
MSRNLWASPAPRSWPVARGPQYGELRNGEIIMFIVTIFNLSIYIYTYVDDYNGIIMDYNGI